MTQSIDSRIDPLILTRMEQEARAAATHSYSPYSHFKVGCAILTNSGNIYSGCNVENASYGLTNCAERTAIFSAAARGERTIKAIVVFTPTNEPTAPCGACRQVINEFGEDIPIISICDSDRRLTCTSGQLLPLAFGPGSFSS